MISGQRLTKRKLLFISLTFAGLMSANAFAETTDFRHTVSASDNLTAIRDMYCDSKVTTQQIAKYNTVANANLIHPGDVINIKAEWLKSTSLPIKVIVFSGDVKLQKNGDGAIEPLTQSQVLDEGDKLFTGANSLVKLRFADDSVVNLQPNAVMQIVSSRKQYQSDKMQIVVDVQQGRTEVLANPEHKANRQFKVKTPSAVAVVRGTKFRVGSEAGKTIEETLGGSVDFAVNADKVQVGKGFGSFAEAGQPPAKPIALPPAPDVTPLQTKFDFAPVAFDIAQSEKVVAVNVQLSQAKDFSSLISSHRLNAAGDQDMNLALGAISDGDYYLKLRSENSEGLQSEDVIHAFTVDVYPLPPEPVLITGNFAPASGWPLQWSRIEGADRYFLQLSDTDSFDNVVYEQPTFYNSFYLTPQLAKNATHWRVGIRTDQNTVKYSKSIALGQLD